MKANQAKKILRNPFVALCDNASRYNWCWKIHCTTCGHGILKASFSKLIRELHPDSDEFWPYGKDDEVLNKESERYRDFMRSDRNFLAAQMSLASIVADAKLSDIISVANFPDWLGYIGLVMYHCPSYMARKVISDSLLPQFIDLLKNDKEICDYLIEKLNKNEILDINDLNRIEIKKVNLKNSPRPLIFDIS